MKKKGFTLIELLAVIVVLAIIALIATPIVMNTIKSAKKGAAERSADSYIKQVETIVATERLDGNILEGEYIIQSDGNLCLTSGCGDSNKDKIIIDMKGTKPSSGKITISNGNVEISEKITVGTFDVVYNPTTKSYEATEKGGSSSEDDTPVLEVLCKSNTTKASALVWSGGADPSQESSYSKEEVGLLATSGHEYDTGVTYTCELGDGKESTFYVLETNGDNVSLIAGFNLGNTVAWCGNEAQCKEDIILNNTKGPLTANDALKERTSAWTKLNQSQIILPTADQIAKTLGESLGDSVIVGLETWLYSYTELPVAQGYWTSTPSQKNSYDAWYVIYAGGLDHDNYDIDGNFIENDITSTTYYGIRPVITISKSQLS